MGLRTFSRGPLFALEELLRSSKNYLLKVSLLVAVHDGGTPNVPARVARQRHEKAMKRKLFQLLNNWLVSLPSSHQRNQEERSSGNGGPRCMDKQTPSILRSLAWFFNLL